MKNATKMLWIGALVLALTPSWALAAIPDGKIAVVRVTSVDGLALVNGPIEVTRESAFSYDGTTYSVDLASLDGIKTLVLIDHRTDSAGGGKVTRAYSQEVRAITDSHFEITDIPGKTLTYQVASIAGVLQMTGDGDQILVPSGDNGPYHMWKVESVNLVNASAIELR